MLPVRLEIKNFLAYRSPEPVRFDGIHLACLTGANGAGKSSLLDAITWVLWGEARAKRDEELVHLGQSDMAVLLEFEQDGLSYIVNRKRSRKGTATLDLFAVDEDGTPNDISEPTTRGTQERINRLINLNYKTFVHSAFLQQGKADAFTTKTPSERKKILSDILDLDRWNTYEEAVKEKIKSIEMDISNREFEIERIAEEIKQEPALLAALAEAQAQQDAAKAALDIAETALKQVEHAPAQRAEALRRKAEIEMRQRHIEGDIKAAEDEIKRQQAKVAQYEATIARQAEITAGYAALQDARDMDHELGDKLMTLGNLDKQRNEVQRQLDAARAELRNEMRGCEATINGLERTIKAALPEALEDVRAQIARLEALEDERTSLQEKMSLLQTEKGERDSTNKSLKIEMDELKDRITRLSAAHGAVCPLCGQPLTEEHQLSLLTELQAQGKARGDTFRANGARMTVIAEETRLTQERMTDIRVELQRLADLQKREGELTSGVKKAQEAELQLDEERAHLDAVRATLEGEAFAPDLRAQIAAMDAERAALGYDGDRHSAARQGLEKFREFEAQQKQLENALEHLPDAEALLQATIERRESRVRAQADETAALEQNVLELERLDVLVREEQARRAEVNHQRMAHDTAYRKLINAQQALKAIEDGRLRKASLEVKLTERKVERTVYDELRLAFSKNGIPAMIIETAIPELESGANRLLNRMTDGRMSLMLTTQREKVTGGVAETLDIQVADELGTRAYDLFSGGEAFRINFALRVALSQLLARRAGAQLRTLFIDEGFGTQDEEGRNKLVEAITAIQEDFDLILVITHIEDLRDAFPVHVMVEKLGDGSRISVR